mmetsp:Transcript_129328/g.258226  ORF Transcript_129328/g.258226 Transcript_129328/m.258226 type:complete len:215 (+) Transcript_129328:47-691(+)
MHCGGAFGETLAQSMAADELSTADELRQHVFALERELFARRQSDQQRQKVEHVRRIESEAKLMEVNCALGEKLKAATAEAQQAERKVNEMRSKLEETRQQINDRHKEITKIKYQIELGPTVAAAAEVSHRQQHRAQMRSAAREAAMLQMTRHRADTLCRCKGGDATADLIDQCTPKLTEFNAYVEQIEAKMLERFTQGSSSLRWFEEKETDTIP